MASGSDVGLVKRFRAAQSSYTRSSSRVGIPAAPSTSGKVLQALQGKSVCKAVTEIADQDGGVESRIKDVVDDALTGDKVR